MTYQQGKERARDCAIEWQLDYNNHSLRRTAYYENRY